jgi:isopenicillin-N epimerase
MQPSRRLFMQQLFAASGAVTALGQSEHAAAALPGIGKPPDDEAYWHWVASQFLTNPDVAYMNTGTRGPSPRQVIKAQFDSIRSYDSDRLSYARYVDNSESRAALRARLAAFVGCDAGEIACTNNTTEGMAFGTLGLALKPGDEIVYTNHDHASGAQPVNLAAARYGAKAVVVDLSAPELHPPKNVDVIVDAFARVITKRTKLISFCHVNYTDGCCMPVREICAMARARGILTLVDGAHPPGMMDLDIHSLGCDMYAGAGHKWMLASMLTGFFVVRSNVLDRLWPLVYSGPVAGKTMYGIEAEATAYNLQAKTAARYEMRGSKSYTAAASLNAALDFHEAITPSAIEARVRHLAALARNGLRAIPGVTVHVSDQPSLSCGLVSFSLRGVDPVEMNELLWTRYSIYIRDVSHPEIDWIVSRASLHIMVDAQQVAALVAGVAEIARERNV